MAETRTVKVVVTAAVDQLIKSMRDAGNASETAAKRAEKAFAGTKLSLDQVGRAAAITSGAFTVAFVAMVKASADFEQRMSQVQALSKATAGQMSKLRDAAFTAGKAFGLSATQVADAQIELTKAGVSVKDIIGGALPGALALAAAGQIDVAKATTIASNAMTEFGLAGKDVPHLADVLAAGADKSVASVESLGDALNQSGLVAAQFGLTAEDTIGVLTAFSKAGLNGSDAGTSFKTMLLSLASPSKQAQKYLDEYNITAYDSQGAFVGITNLADQLQTKLGKVSAAQRNAALSTIFGTDAIRAANVLYTDGGKKLQGFIDANNEAGFAALQASKKLDNLNGDVQKLGASLQNDLIKSGSAANDALRGISQSATGLLDTFGDLPKPVQAVALEVAGVGAAVTGLGAAFLLLGPKLLASKKALQELGVTGKSLAGTFGKGAILAVGLQAIGGGIANLGAQGEVNAQQLQQASLRIKGSYKDLDKAFPSSGVFDFGGGGAKASLETLDGFLGKTNQLAANFVDGATAAVSFGQAGTHLGDVFKSNQETFAATGTALAGFAKQDYSGATSSFNRLVTQLGGGSDKVQELLKYMPDYKSALVDFASTAGVAASKQNLLSIATGRGGAADALRIALAGEKENTSQLTALSGAAVAASSSVSDLAKTIAGFGSTTLDAHAAERAFQQAVDDASAAIKKNGQTANKQKTALDISTQAGRDNQAALEGIASSADAAAAKIYEQTGSTEKAAAAVRAGRKEFIAQAVQAGLSAAAAKHYADQLQLIPGNVSTALKLTGAGGVVGQIAAIKAAMNNLDGTRANVYIAGRVSGLSDAQASRIQRNIPVRASGGSITGPGPKGKDSVLAYLAPGEHVFTAKEVDKMGGQSAVYAFRKGIQGFAAGGGISPTGSRILDLNNSLIQAAIRAATKTTVGSAAKRAVTTGSKSAIQQATDAISSASRDKTDLTKQLTTAKKKLASDTRAANAADKAYDKARDAAAAIHGKGTSEEKHAAEMRARQLKKDADAAKKATEAQQKRVDSVSKKLDTATQKVSDQTARRVALRNQSEDFTSAQNRATPDNPIDPLSYVDQLRSMSRDDNYSVSDRHKFDDAANQYEKSLVDLADKSDKAAKKLDDLKSSADSMRSSITSSIAGQYGTSGIQMNTATTAQSVMRGGIRFTTAGTTSGTSASAIDAYYQKGASTSGQFAAQLQLLANRGINGAFLAEIAQDPNGAQLATALLSATTGQIASINSNYTAIQGNAATAAGTVTDYNYGALISNAQSNADQITKQIAVDGEKLRKLIATAFGLSGYATGTDYASAGWHLVGEQGPELAKFSAGGQVKNNRWLTSAAAAAGGAGGNVTVTGPQSVTIMDADGKLMGTFATVANGVARQVVAADAHTNAVLIGGGAA